MIDEPGTATVAEPQSMSPETPAQAEPPRASIDRAFASVDAREQSGDASPPPADPSASDAPEQSHSEPPARFSAEAKAAWQTAPEAIRTETHRSLRELETGLGHYRQTLEPLKPYFDLAREHNTTVHEAMERYTALDRALLSDDPQVKLTAITSVLDHAGMTPEDFSRRALEQKQPPAAQPPDEPLSALRREIADLKNEMGGISSSLTQRQRDEAKREMDAFAKEHPRLTDAKFAEVFSRLLATGMAEGLDAAYDMADRLDPAPVPPKPPPNPEGKGKLSVSGPPTSGSNPVNRKAPATARESLDRSFASLGLG